MLLIMIHQPACALWFAPSGDLFPAITRDSMANVYRQLGGRRRFNEAKQAGAIHHVDHLRYDRHGPLAREGIDEVGRTYLALNPHLPCSLVVTAGGSDGQVQDMTRIFAFRDDAEQAAADVARMLQRLSRDVALHREATSPRAG